MIKRTFLMSAAMLLIASASNATTITITKDGGGVSGYDRIEEHSGDGWKTLSCVDPGYSDCKFAERVVIGSGDNEQSVDGDVAAYVEAQIAKDIHSGTYTVDDDHVAWSVNEGGGYTITIN